MFCSNFWFFFFSSRSRHTRCALVTGVQTCALPIFLKSSHATQATVRFAGVKVLDDKGVEPDSGGRAPESLDQESVEREDVQQESAKSAVSQLAGARLPLEAVSVVLGEDGHIQSAPANRPLAFRFAACGVQFGAEIGRAHV